MKFLCISHFRSSRKADTTIIYCPCAHLPTNYFDPWSKYIYSNGIRQSMNLACVIYSCRKCCGCSPIKSNPGFPYPPFPVQRLLSSWCKRGDKGQEPLTWHGLCAVSCDLYRLGGKS